MSIKILQVVMVTRVVSSLEWRKPLMAPDVRHHVKCFQLVQSPHKLKNYHLLS